MSFEIFVIWNCIYGAMYQQDMCLKFFSLRTQTKKLSSMMFIVCEAGGR